MKKFITSRFNILARILHDWFYVFQLGGPKNPQMPRWLSFCGISSHWWSLPRFAFQQRDKMWYSKFIILSFFLSWNNSRKRTSYQTFITLAYTLYRKSKISFYSFPLFTSLNNEFIAYYPLNMITEIFYFNISLNSLI